MSDLFEDRLELDTLYFQLWGIFRNKNWDYGMGEKSHSQYTYIPSWEGKATTVTEIFQSG